MREFKYGVGVIAPNFLLNLLFVKMTEKSFKKANFQSKNQKVIFYVGSFLKMRKNMRRDYVFRQFLQLGRLSKIVVRVV